MDEKKVEYVAVPTTEYQHPTPPAPAPCTHCTSGPQPCRRRRRMLLSNDIFNMIFNVFLFIGFCYVKALLIGGAVALLTYNAVSHWSSSSQVHTCQC